LGWLMETVRVSLRNKKFVNRGYAGGPYCPIYGFGMCFVILFLSGMKDNLPCLFFGGMLITTVLEYLTAYLLELIFKAKWWDYSYRKFNLHGRICLDISIAWGVLSVVMIEYVVPLLNVLIDKIDATVGSVLILLILAFMAADIAVTTHSILSFRAVLLKLHSLKSEIKSELELFSDKFSENIKEYIDVNELNVKLNEWNMKKSDIKTKFDEKCRALRDSGTERLRAKFSDKMLTSEKLEAIGKIRYMHIKYEMLRRFYITKTHKRVLDAFPGFGMKNVELQEIVKSLKDKLGNKN
jgi:uncharacterized membrane protein